MENEEQFFAGFAVAAAVPTPSWAMLRKKADELESKRPNDSFLRTVLRGALMVGESNNPIRGNLCASALREVVGHLLHALAPDEKVVRCGWYKPDPKTNGPTRKQRTTYIVQGGLPTAFVTDTLHLDVNDVGRPLTKAMDRLHGSTHVRENTVLTDDEKIRGLVDSSLNSLLDLLDAAASCQREVHSKMEHQVNEAVFDKFISDTIQELDELSNHTRFEAHAVDDIKVVDVDSDLITYQVTGTVYVQLIYGSSSDFRRGDGATMNDSYPYKATLAAKVTEPMQVVPGSVDVFVDNSSFFDNGDDEDDDASGITIHDDLPF